MHPTERIRDVNKIFNVVKEFLELKAMISFRFENGFFGGKKNYSNLNAATNRFLYQKCAIDTVDILSPFTTATEWIIKSRRFVSSNINIFIGIQHIQIPF